MTVAIMPRRSIGLGLFLGVAVAGPARPQVPVTAFIDVSVIPMDRERVLQNQTVLIRGERIVALGPARRVPVPADAVRIDGRGKFLMPGLADMHVHFWWTKGGPPVGDTTNVADVLMAFLANGVTTVRDMHSGGKDSWTLRLRQRVASGELLGPRIYTAGDPDQSSPEAAAASVVALKAAGHDFVKLYGFGRPLYDSVVIPARRVGLRVVGHAPHRAAPGFGIVRRGANSWPALRGDAADTVVFPQVLADHWASIEHLTGYDEYLMAGRVAAPLDQARLRAIAAATRRAGVWNCPTLTILATFRPSIAPYLQIAQALRDAGAGLLLGTDAFSGPSVPYGFSVHRELELLVEAGLTPYQALATGTRNVADFLGTLDSTGTVAVGKRADLVLLTANPLANIRHTAALAGVMAAGRWLSRAGLQQRLDSVAAVPVAANDPTYGTWPVLMRWARLLVWR